MTQSAPPGRRERKKLATRAAVSAAALRLAVRHGVEHVTVEQIAAESDIALRTFFNHFPGKEDAILAASAAAADALVAGFRTRPPAESVFGALREAVLAVMDGTGAAGRDHLAALRLIRTAPSLVPHQLAVLARQETALASAIADRLDGGAAVSPVYPALCAAAALSALRVTLDRWLDATADAEPSTDVLRADLDTALAELAAGLDRPGGA
ncbi:TetR/AcrR family transcriptional regulator [Pseudonocardia abyssalis]|uniref:TetR family transcriptional regulator n=1 Tax=Pseudonocardia abyssalis TaxID=2792008 RepID=A0ABS6UWN9_9PSEU|nr:TetR family transcriptional regulator [Pseudonocardia abyssalis]MBW0114689.1 TetR family transcriptional regulator [Pseudonocardia abyssalis]MBW0136684.1 TetR family transcriptional regulator [Pseudonocardia abyssalis]